MQKNIIVTITIILSSLVGQASFSGMENAYHVQSLAMTLGGSLTLNSESDRLNPAMLVETTERSFSFGVLSYPADITSGMVIVRLPVNKRVFSFAVRQLNYGYFDGYDIDGQATGSYTAGDTWLTAAVAGHAFNKISYGISTGVFLSHLEEYSAAAITVTPGLIIKLPERSAHLGLAIRNSGLVLSQYSSAKESLPTTIVTSFSKQLEHLPLNLNFDFGYRTTDQKAALSVSGLFQLPYNLQLRLGSSTDKIDQSPGEKNAQDLLGATGVALTYLGTSYSFDIGSYFYGPGAWVSGIGLGVVF